MVVGFGRSLVNMDRLGLVAKRYLIHDPYNPTTSLRGARRTVRLAALYAVLGVMAIALAVRPAGRRTLAFLVVTAIPVGGLRSSAGRGSRAISRDVPRAVPGDRNDGRAARAARAPLIAAAAVAALFVALNVPAISRARRDAQCAALTARLQSVPRQVGRPTVLFTPHELDEISTFRNRCPDAALLREVTPPRAFGLAMANNENAERWRAELARRADSAWAQGGRVWISRRAFVTSPLPSWKWAEGDDPRLHWKDFQEYFAQVDVGPPVGGEDGFVEVLPTPRTREAVARLRTVVSSAP